MDKNREIIIYYTNDMHGRMSTHDDNEASIGIDKISKIVNLSQLTNVNTFWLDAGDFTHGTPRMNIAVDDLVETLNSAPIDAICTGNHDYNLSMEHLYRLSKDLNAYLLSANTVDKDTKSPVLLPYVIYTVDLENNNHLEATGDSNDSKLDDIKIGVFGISTPETAYKTNPKNLENVEFLNPIEVSRNMVAMLKHTCHIVIALTHLGLDGSSEFTSDKLVNAVPGIDIVIDGHSHTELPNGMKVNNTLIVQAGSHGHYLGQLVMQVNKDKKVIDNVSTRLLTQEQVDAIIKTPDSFIEDKIHAMDDITDSVLDRAITFNKIPLFGSRSIVRKQESELGNLVSDAFRWKTGADIAVVNGGTIRTDLPMGDVTFKHLVSIFPFENNIQVVKITGRTILQMLEHAFGFYPSTFGGFLHNSNMIIAVKLTDPSGQRVRSVYIDGKLIEKDKTYTMAALDFMLVGGDDFSMLKDLKVIGDYGHVEDIVAKYLTDVGINADAIKPNRIKIL